MSSSLDARPIPNEGGKCLASTEAVHRVDRANGRGYTRDGIPAAPSWALSSGGESAPLIRVRSVVRVHEGPPDPNKKAVEERPLCREFHSHLPLSLHDLSTYLTLLHGTASASRLSSTLLSCSHSPASAFLCHVDSPPRVLPKLKACWPRLSTRNFALPLAPSPNEKREARSRRGLATTRGRAGQPWCRRRGRCR